MAKEERKERRAPDTVLITLNVPAAAKDELDALRAELGMTLSEFTRRALEEAARRHGREVDLHVQVGGYKRRSS